MYLYKLEAGEGAALLNWWRWLEDNRGDRAILRRAKSPEDALLTAAFAHFLQKMPSRWAENKVISLVDAAMTAAVIARVDTHKSDISFAKSLGKPKEVGGKAVMSELRFQQLQKSRTEDEFFMRVCRAVDLLKRKTNVVSLADNILHWLAESRSAVASKPMDRLAVRWASDYYEVFKD